jgi:hypothetical protein
LQLDHLMPLDAIVQHNTPGFKKLGREGKDLPPNIILIRDQNIVLAEKIPEPCSPSLAGRYRPLCNGPAGGWRIGRNPGVDGAQRGDFLTKPKIRARGGSNQKPRVATRKPQPCVSRESRLCRTLGKQITNELSRSCFLASPPWPPTSSSYSPNG